MAERNITTPTTGTAISTTTFGVPVAQGLSGIGVSSDNDNNPQFARSAGTPGRVKMTNKDANIGLAVLAAGTTTIAAGKWFVGCVFLTGTTKTTITPSGGAAQDVTGTAAGNPRTVCIHLGPGDSITLGTGAILWGYYISAPTGFTAINKNIKSGTNYTCTAGKTARITTVFGVSGNPTFSVNGVTATVLHNVQDFTDEHPLTIGLDGLLVAATQTLSTTSATEAFISGYEA